MAGAWIIRVVQVVLDAVVGCRCAGCGQGASSNPCPSCRRHVLDLPVARQAAVLDAPPASTLVRIAKHGDWRAGGRLFGDVVAARLHPRADVDLVTWVPANPARRRRRGGHLPERIARRVAGRLGVPAVELLSRRSGGSTQRGLDRAQRIRNANRSYAMRSRHRFGTLHGARVLLVDDVRTTGATLDAAASVLREAGAVVIAVAAVGRGDALEARHAGVGNLARSGNLRLMNHVGAADVHQHHLAKGSTTT